MALTGVNTAGGLRKDKLRIIDKFGRFMPVGFITNPSTGRAGSFRFMKKRSARSPGLAGSTRVFQPRTAPRTMPGAMCWSSAAVRPAWQQRVRPVKSACVLCSSTNNPALVEAWPGQHARHAEADRLMREHIDALQAMPNVEIRCGTTIGGHYADHWIAMFDAVRLTKLRARTVVYATGAIEQPAVFGHNDLPGVMLASAAQRLIRHYAIKPFDEAVILAANGDAYRAALDLLEAGACGSEPSSISVHRRGIGSGAGQSLARRCPFTRAT